VEKRHRLSHHEVHEEHEGQARKMSHPIFVSFMIFMVKKVVLGFFLAFLAPSCPA